MEVPEDIDQYIEEHRTQEHQDPAVLEELEPRENDADDVENENDSDADNLPAESDEEANEDDSEDDSEEIWAEFKRKQEIFENKLKENLHDKNFRKSFKKYTSSVAKVASSQSENMKQHLYAFGQSLGKSKRGSRIPVQTTAVSRRKHPQGGRAVGMSGRRVQDAPKRMRMDVTGTEEVHTLPIQKPQAPRQPHNLAVAEARNVANAKKH